MVQHTGGRYNGYKYSFSGCQKYIRTNRYRRGPQFSQFSEPASICAETNIRYLMSNIYPLSIDPSPAQLKYLYAYVKDVLSVANIPITKIVIYTARLRVVLYTSLPCPYPHNDYHPSFTFDIEEADSGIQYVLDNFPDVSDIQTFNGCVFTNIDRTSWVNKVGV